jgi:hypothetical protein
MKRQLVAASILLALAAPAGATEWIFCTAEGDAASAGILVGMVDVISIAQAKVEAGNKKWATDAEGDSRIRVGQAFEDSEKIVVDFTDDGVSSIVASLRLFKASEGDDYVTGGTLRITGSGAWAVTCSGP